jgi:predicted transcriptional regulator
MALGRKIVYQWGVAAKKPIPVRLSDELIARLDAAAEKVGSNRAAVIRMLLDRWVTDFEKRGTAMLPVDWPGIMEGLDGRSSVAKVAEEEPAYHKKRTN